MKYTTKHQTILNNFKKTGEEFDFFLGSIYGGAQSSLEDLIAHAQVFANAKYRGALVSGKTFQYGLNKTERLGIHGGLCLNHNGEPQYTSYVLIDKNEDLGNIRETYTSAEFNPLYANANSTNLSDIVSSLENMAEEIEVETKILGITRKKQLKLVQKQTSNPVCSCVDKIYQIAYAKLENDFNTNLEKVTAAVLATYITTKALDLKEFDARTDEALRMNFCTHLNGCYANGSLSLSNVIKNGVDLGIELIETMGYGKDDVKAKCERLGTPLQNEPKTLNEALFGAKQIEKSLSVFVNEDKKETTFTAVSEDKKDSKDEMEEKVKAAVSTSVVPTTKINVVDPKKEGVSDNNNIQQEDGTILKIGEVAHKKGNAVNRKTLIDNITGQIASEISNIRNKITSKGENKSDIEALAESNFWTGVIDAINGKKKQQNLDSYSKGYDAARPYRVGLEKQVDDFYSDNGELKVNIETSGKAATSKLSKMIAEKLNLEVSFVAWTVSELKKVFSNFKESRSKDK